MTERPIIFSAPMVKAILAGTKTQTRRIVKFTDAGYLKQPGGNRRWHRADPEAVAACPYGAPGDSLWVRETWWHHKAEYLEQAGFKGGSISLLEDNSPGAYLANEEFDPVAYPATWKKRPSIHMPRWASRLSLEVVGVRVERLQDITQADARAEGLTAITKDGDLIKYGIPDRDGLPGTDNDGWPWQDWDRDPRAAYRRLWESINGPGSWDLNPWIWVILFRKIAT